jgi:hypothetical protein
LRQLVLVFLLDFGSYEYMNQNKGGFLERKRVNFDVTEEEHRQIKVLAAKEGKTVKELLLDALEKLFPNWRKQ